MKNTEADRLHFESLCKADRPFPLDTTRQGEGYLYPVTNRFWYGYQHTGEYGVVFRNNQFIQDKN